MSDVFRGLYSPQQNVNLNHFDLSRRHIFSSKPGLLNPVLCIDTVPGDKIRINTASICRLQPLISPAFLRAKAYFHFYFVPYSQIWRRWPEFLAQKDDPVSSYEKGFSYVPVFNIADLIGDLKTQANTNNYKDVFQQNAVGDMCRIAQLLGYGGPRLKNASDDSSQEGYTVDGITNQQTLYVNPFRACAYQKIWSDYYRNPYYDTNVPVDYFNLDDFDCSSFENAKFEENRGNASSSDPLYTTPAGFFQPRYRTWSKDLFMGTLPSQQDGVVSSVSLSNIQIQSTAISDSTTPAGNTLNAGIFRVSSSSPYAINLRDSSNASLSSNWNINNAFSVLQLRQAEALQRWKETTLRAGQRAQSQQKGHYGMTAKHIADERCEFIDGFEMTLNVDDVVATSAGASDVTTTPNSSNTLGALAGKGIGTTGGKTIKYNATEFGVLMCMLSIVPDAEYDATMIDYANTLSQPFDFFTKEFENLGLQPLSRVLLDYNRAVQSSQVNKVLGYVPQYAGYKTAVDKVFGSFVSHGSLSAWSTPRLDLETNSLNPAGIGLPKSCYYISPHCLDNVFIITTDQTTDTDPFLFNTHFEVSALRNMSVLGLPQY